MKEIPRPDLRRAGQWWLSLNGAWQFETDRAASGRARGYASGRRLAGQITVPFCPESRLSGVADRDFLNAVWYRRIIQVPDHWRGRRVLLHVGACDYLATVWLNGREVGRHEGGYTPFSCELTDALLENPAVAGFCYTQLTDVEQEINGLLTCDRGPKFPPEEAASILRQKAAIER